MAEDPRLVTLPNGTRGVVTGGYDGPVAQEPQPEYDPNAKNTIEILAQA